MITNQNKNYSIVEEYTIVILGITIKRLLKKHATENVT